MSSYQLAPSTYKRARTSYGPSKSSGGLYRKNATFYSKGGRQARSKGRPTNAGVRRIARQVMLASQEVKYLDDVAANQTVGQVNLDASGHNTTSMSITPAQGTGVDRRIGDCISGEKIIFNIQYSRLANTASKIHLKHYVVAFFGSTPTPVIADFLSENLVLESLNTVDIYDTGCFRDPQYKRTVKVLGAFSHVFDARVSTDGSADNATGGSRQFEVDLKGMKIHYDSTSGALSNVTIALVTLASQGNRSGTPSTLLGLVTNTQSTGVTMQIASRFLYRDA